MELGFNLLAPVYSQALRANHSLVPEKTTHRNMSAPMNIAWLNTYHIRPSLPPTSDSPRCPPQVALATARRTPKFARFLSRAVATLELELTRARASKAFDEFGAGGFAGGFGDGGDAALEVAAAARLYALAFNDGFAATSAATAPPPASSAASKAGAYGKASAASASASASAAAAARIALSSPFGSVSALSWSANGHTVAAAYGRTDHVAFCAHRSAVVAWNLMRQRRADDGDGGSDSNGSGSGSGSGSGGIGAASNAASSKPDVVLETDCCVTSLAFHPTDPNLLVGGLFSGELCLWNIAANHSNTTSNSSGQQQQHSSEPLLARSRIDDCFHREPIAQVAWVRSGTYRWLCMRAQKDGEGAISAQNFYHEFSPHTYSRRFRVDYHRYFYYESRKNVKIPSQPPICRHQLFDWSDRIGPPLPAERGDEYHIASVSGDGKVLFWPCPLAWCAQALAASSASSSTSSSSSSSASSSSASSASSTSSSSTVAALPPLLAHPMRGVRLAPSRRYFGQGKVHACTHTRTHTHLLGDTDG